MGLPINWPSENYLEKLYNISQCANYTCNWTPTCTYWMTVLFILFLNFETISSLQNMCFFLNQVWVRCWRNTPHSQIFGCVFPSKKRHCPPKTRTFLSKSGNQHQCMGWLISHVILANLWCSAVGSNTSLDIAMKVFLHVINTYSQLTLSYGH